MLALHPEPTSAQPALLQTRALDIEVGGRTLIRGLELEIRAGTTTAVLGPNGSGKTLCLLTLAGLRRPARGAVCLGDTALTALPRRAVAQRIGYLPQDSGNEVVGTVRDFLTLGLYPAEGFGLEVQPDATARIDAALQALDLDTLATRSVASLSGGERRRLELALLRVQTAPLWLLDEPTNHLDPNQQAVLLGLLRAHAQAGGAAVISLHDASLAIDCADQVLCLSGDGRWDCGSTANMLTAERVSALYRTTMALAPRFAPLPR